MAPKPVPSKVNEAGLPAPASRQRAFNGTGYALTDGAVSDPSLSVGERGKNDDKNANRNAGRIDGRKHRNDFLNCCEPGPNDACGVGAVKG
jgi:hypothetical protein